MRQGRTHREPGRRSGLAHAVRTRAADGLAIVPEDVGELEAGAEVDVIRLDIDQRLRCADAAMTGESRPPFEPTARKDKPSPDPRRPPRPAAHGGRQRQAARRRGGPSPRRGSGWRRRRSAWSSTDRGPRATCMSVAELAGVMGAKRTSELIPLCHPIALTDIGVEITPDRVEGLLRIRATAATVGPTGRGDGGPDRGDGRGADRLRHGQGRRPLRRDPCPCACSRRAAASPGSGVDHPMMHPRARRPRVPKGSRGPRRSG